MKSLFLVVRSGPAAGGVFQMDRQGARIGRDPSCEIQIKDNLVSKLHAEVFVDLLSGTFVIHDLGSKNGLHVNGESVTEKTLEIGDEIRVGRSRIFCTDRAPANTIEGASRSLTALAELGRLAGDADPLDSLDALAQRLRDAVGCDGAAIAVFEDGVTKPLIEVHASDREPPADRETAALLGRTNAAMMAVDASSSGDDEDPLPLRPLINEAARRKQPVYVEDVRKHAELNDDLTVAAGDIRMCLCLPLVVEGTVLGVAQLYKTEAGLDPAARATADVAASIVALALKRAL